MPEEDEDVESEEQAPDTEDEESDVEVEVAESEEEVTDSEEEDVAEDDNTVYRYTIPLEEDDGVEAPAYNPSHSGEVYEKHYTANNFILVQDDAIPHYHRDEVSVTVEELDKDEYDQT